MSIGFVQLRPARIAHRMTMARMHRRRELARRMDDARVLATLVDSREVTKK
jgi:hypothetical protein